LRFPSFDGSDTVDSDEVVRKLSVLDLSSLNRVQGEPVAMQFA